MKKQKKQIDIVTKYFYPVTAGIELNILETYSNFVKKGWIVNVHTSTDAYTKKGVFKKREIVNGINVYRYDYGLFGFNPKIEWGKTNVLSLHNFNIFPHVQLFIKILTLKLLNKKRFTFALTPHGGYTPDWNIFPIHARILKYTYHHTVGLFFINTLVDTVQTISEWESKQANKRGIKKSKILLVMNGIEKLALKNSENLVDKKTKMEIKGLGKYIVQMGRIYKIKNYETVIKSLKYLPEDIKFVIVGPIADLEYKKRLDKLISKLNLKNRVIFYGEVKGSKKFYILKNALLMTHMAHWESFCNAVNEGMSQGLICLVSNNSALKYLIENDKNGYLIDENDHIELAEKITFVIENNNSPKLVKMKEVNKQKGLSWTWEKKSKELMNHYAIN